VVVGVLLLAYAFVSHDFRLRYVSRYSDRSMTTTYLLTALWGGQDGSLLWWTLLLGGYTAACVRWMRGRYRQLQPIVIATLMVVLTFFAVLMIFAANPFEQNLTGAPPDGDGLNPLLQNYWMIIHPPMLYLGFVSFVIPFAFAIAALVTGRTDDRWIRITRRWTLVAWMFLSLGLVLGGRWAYDVLGWGGYWGWDPVEIAAFMPWLTGTAFVHSVMIQEKRGMFKHWNTLLIILTYLLVIIGTFLTRSGVLSSVHAFAQSAIGPAFFVFMAITFIVSIGLLIYRWNDLKSESELKSVFSREAFFLLNNLFFMSILVVCFWGVFFPLISELFTGQKVTVGPPFYERATSPLFAALIFLMGVAPLSAWGHSTAKTLGRAMWKPAVAAVAAEVIIIALGLRNPIALFGLFIIILTLFITLHELWRGIRARSKATGENFFLSSWRLVGRNRRRYGGYTIHISMVFMAIGILGLELFQTETQGTIAQGESMQLGGYTLTYKDLAVFDTADARNIARAVVEVSRNGEVITELYPRRDFFYESQQPMTIPGVRSTIQDDLYVILIDWQPILATGATFKIYHNPLVNWLWAGSLLFIFGALVAVWPDKDPEYESARERARTARQTSAAD
jgi:cytochrome c-type biogenesis protein CcmF